MSGDGQARPLVSVVVLVHDRVDLSRACLEAAATALSGLDHELFCFDNGSRDDVAPLRDLAASFRAFHWMRSDRNLTFAAANNAAAARASGTFLLLLNNDVLCGRDSVRALLATASDPGVGVVGARLLYPEGRRVQHAGIRQMLWGRVSNYGVGADAGDDRFLQPQEMFAVTGAMMLVPTRTFRAVAGLDERYAWGYEDVDLCLKVRATGRRVLYQPTAESTHVESATLRERRDSAAADANYRRYRATWDHVLRPPEHRLLSQLREGGVERVVVFGAGEAGAALQAVLASARIETVAFASTSVAPKIARAIAGIPVVPLEETPGLSFDRLVVGSQFYYQVEHSLRRFDPLGAPLLPVVC